MGNARQLAIINEFVALCTAASLPCWLRGGWAMDFFLGRVTRDHEDIDLFVWAKDVSTLVHELEHAGYVEHEGPLPDAQRDFIKDGEQVQVVLLARNPRGQVVVAGGSAAGAPWPDDMRVYPAGRIADIQCPIIHPRVQIWIKEQFPIWRPELPLSEKHRNGIRRLRDTLAPGGDQGTAGSESPY